MNTFKTHAQSTLIFIFDCGQLLMKVNYTSLMNRINICNALFCARLRSVLFVASNLSGFRPVALIKLVTVTLLDNLLI